MVVVLIRMKLRVLANTLHGARAASVVVGALAGLAFAIGCVVVVLLGAGRPGLGGDIAAVVGAVWLVGWLVGPIMTGGGDETLRPENFALLPLPPRKLAVGLVDASMVGVAPLVTLVAFAGLVVWGATLGVVPALIGLVGMAAQFVLVVLASRVVVAAIGAALNSRRGRDLGVLLGVAVGLLYLPARSVVASLLPVLTSRQSPGLSITLRALPSGWAALATESAARGRWLFVVLPLAGLAVLIVVLWLVWAALLERRLTTVPASAGPRARRSTEVRAARSTGPLGAVVRKELQLWRRDATRRSLLLSSVLLGLLIPIFAAGGSRGLGAYAALWLVFFSAVQVSNLYGYDGDSLWHTLVTPSGLRYDVPGRQIAWLIIVAPLAVVVAVAGPLITGRYAAFPWLAGLVPVALGAGCGLVVLISVLSPYPMPKQRQRNPFAGNSGNNPGCTRVALRLVSMLGMVVIAAPVVILDALGSSLGLPVLQWIGVVVGVAIGVASVFVAGSVARQRLEQRGPEVLAAVKPA